MGRRKKKKYKKVNRENKPRVGGVEPTVLLLGQKRELVSEEEEGRLAKKGKACESNLRGENATVSMSLSVGLLEQPRQEQ
jgi:hypothetical protein